MVDFDKFIKNNSNFQEHCKECINASMCFFMMHFDTFKVDILNCKIKKVEE